MKQSKYHHFCIRYCIFCFSIEIFYCKNKCTVHISLRRYPSISPSKAGDKYSWSCMFVIFSTVSCSDVHGRLRFTAQKLKSLQLVFLLYKSNPPSNDLKTVKTHVSESTPPWIKISGWLVDIHSECTQPSASSLYWGGCRGAHSFRPIRKSNSDKNTNFSSYDW